MLLAADIGNTNISFGLFKGRRILKRLDIPRPDFCARRLRGFLGKRAVEDSIVCSVVPEATRLLEAGISALMGEP